jgi:putative PIN family toxin of toxin-antitoxin system
LKELVRVVFDVNVWVNGLVGKDTEYPFLPSVPPTGGNSSADCMSLAFDGDRFSVFTSPHILRNIARTLEHLGISKKTRERAISDVVEMVVYSLGSVVELERVVVHQRDHEDNRILDLVLQTNSDVLVTEDQELLAANGWKGRAILHPAAFVKLALTIRPS